MKNYQCKAFVALIARLKNCCNLHKNMNENMFSFTFLCKFSGICNFAIFIQILMKFSQQCRTKKFWNDIHHFGKFC